MNFFGPGDVAKNYIAIGKGKVNTPIVKMFLLAVMAGAFIGVGALGCTTVGVSVEAASLGKFLGACVFPGGLTMCLLAGSELFTGNCLLTIPLLEKEVAIGGMLKNWIIVYLGNFVGSLLLAAAAVYAHQPSLFGNGTAVSMISTAAGKCSLSFGDAFLKGILCNFLVCIAVWIAFAAKDIAGKIIGLFFPIMMFVLCGFEHSVANMTFIPCGLFCQTIPAYRDAAAAAGIDVSNLDLFHFLAGNLLPVTLGNIVGGAICVGCVYWYVYLKKAK